MSVKHIVGYMTMTGDLLHPGHINMLKVAYSMCDTLLIGLTTDMLGQKQKRKPIFTFQQRKHLLEECVYVNVVVEHHGKSKQEDFRRLGFNILFTGEDYLGSKEYTSFADDYPHVKVVYIPRTSGVSTSTIISTIENKLYEGMSVVAYGINGPIMKVVSDRRSCIIKPIFLGKSEVSSICGRDTYGVSYPPPRNWKVGKRVTNNFPMIGGVNGWRELSIIHILKQFNFSPFYYYRKVFSESHVEEEFNEEGCTVKEKEESGLNKLVRERKSPACIYWLYQKYCGITLNKFLKELKSYELFEEEWLTICVKIESMIKKLKSKGIVHGDLHLNNICILDGTISFIDYGWCLHSSFNMSIEENKYYKSCLTNDFDWKHFVDSLESYDVSLPLYFTTPNSGEG